MNQKAGLVFAMLGLAACTPSRDMGLVHEELTVCANGETVDGIDVSYYQGNIDWAAVKASGIEYAFIRVSDGTGFEDPKFAPNWAGAKNAGVLRGAYQFFRPNQDPIAQADLLLSLMGPLEEGDLPPVIDVEATGSVSPQTIATNVGIWLNRVQSATGRIPIVYSGKYFWNDNVGSTAYSDYPLWIPQYGPTCPDLPNAWSDWVFFQTSGSGSVPGIAGAVDTDLFNGSLADLIAFAGVAASCGDGQCSPGETPDNCAIDCPPCGVIEADGGVIDDGDACFIGGGPAQFLRLETSAGFDGDLIWTHTTASATEANFAEWQLFFVEAGLYRVEVFTDAAFAQSVQAQYRIEHNGASELITLDQTAADGFQVLGEFQFAAGGAQLVHVGDNTGEPGSTNTQLVLDSVQLTRLDAPVDPDPDPVPDPEGVPGGLIRGGCTVAPTAESPLLLFLLVALAFLSRRRLFFPR